MISASIVERKVVRQVKKVDLKLNVKPCKRKHDRYTIRDITGRSIDVCNGRFVGSVSRYNKDNYKFSKSCKVCGTTVEYNNPVELKDHFYFKDGYFRNVCKVCECKEHAQKYKIGHYNYSK